MPHAAAAAMFASMSSMKTHCCGLQAEALRRVQEDAFLRLAHAALAGDHHGVEQAGEVRARVLVTAPGVGQQRGAKPAPRSARIMSYMAGTGALAANMRCSRPSAATASPSTRSSSGGEHLLELGARSTRRARARGSGCWLPSWP